LELGSSRNAAVEGVNEAHAAIEAGSYAHATDVLERTFETAKLLGLTAVQAYAHLNFGRLLIELGREDEAEVEERSALELGMRERGARILGAARIQLARLALARGEAALAEAEALTAVELLEIVPPLRAAARAMLARALIAQDRVEEALEHARIAARSVAQDRGASFDALVRATHAQALQRAGLESEAREVARAAWNELLGRAQGLNAAERDRFLSAPQFHRELRELSGSRATRS
jgi:tetratricopeptide (TPR) repeat protein